jgi:hypothetical protein
MDSMQPMASHPAPAPAPMPPVPSTRPAYTPPEPIGGGVKALLIIIAILFSPIGSIIAWVYGARNAERPGASLVRLVGMIFTVLSIMGGLVFGAAVVLIPGLLTKGQDEFLNQAAKPPAAAIGMQAGQPQGINEAPPEIAATIAELRATVADAVQKYYEDKKAYPTLEELNAAGLLDERFAKDPLHPVENYLVQVTPWEEKGKPGCNVNVKYTGPEASGAGASAAGAEQAMAETAQQVAGSAQQAAPAQRKNSGKRGAERWKQYL